MSSCFNNDFPYFRTINECSLKFKFSSWWKGRTLMEKLLLLILVIMIVIITIIASIRLSQRCPDISKVPEVLKTVTYLENQNICSTHDCFETAVKVYQKLDFNVDPCTDFYKFTCGRFINNTILPKTKMLKSSFSDTSDMVDDKLKTLFEKPIVKTDARSFVLVKSLYQACMNTKEIETNSLSSLKKILNSAGGWPVLEGEKWNKNLFNWTYTMQQFIRLGFNPNMIFRFGLTTGAINVSKSLLLDQPSVFSWMRQGFNQSLVRSYYDFIVKVAIAFGANEERSRIEMKDMVDLEIAIARITLPLEERRNILQGHTITIKTLEETYPYVPWLEYINIFLQPIHKSLTHADKVTITYPPYFKKLEYVMKNISKRTLINFIHWKVIINLLIYLDSSIRSLKTEFNALLTGVSEREPRWKECTHTVRNGISTATGALYVEHFFKKEAKQAVIGLIDEIKEQFVETLKTVDWMDYETRQQALKKAEAIRVHAVYPEELLNIRMIDEHYKNLAVDPTKYLESIQNISRFSLNLYYAKIGKPVNDKDWRRYAAITITNAFYQPSGNSIWLPAGILQDFFFDHRRPHYMNYGGIGCIIGHEITHGFDDMGRHYDKDGELREWWQTTTKAAFDARAQCIIDQYSNITIPELHLNINGKNSRNENIADNGGIKHAYLAYKKWVSKHGEEQILPGLPYTPEQMFWISAGNTWCEVINEQHRYFLLTDAVHLPHYYRINVPLMNSEYFARDFNCPEGSPMNPIHKCTVW